MAAVIASIFVSELERESSYSEANATWKQYSFGRGYFSLELPGEPQAEDIPVSPESAKAFVYNEGFSYSAGDLVVVISFGQLAEHCLRKPERMAAAIADRLKTSRGVADFEYHPGTLAGSRFPFSGTYKVKGEPYELEGFTDSEGAKTCSVVVFYRLSNVAAVAASRRILYSVQKGDTGRGRTRRTMSVEVC